VPVRRVHAQHPALPGLTLPRDQVFVTGEEMTRYAVDLIVKRWIQPNVDISSWEFYDLSVKNRDKTEDKILADAIDAGKRLGAIFKEPTVTPSEAQKVSMGLKKAWGSPNGPMRRGWNGFTISRDTIHIEGMTLGFKQPVLFDRHAVGGEYSAGWKAVGRGKVETVFTGKDGTKVTVDARDLTNEGSVVVTYDNPLDNVTDLAHHFFARCLDMHVTPFVVTKKTVFKWQEGFWTRMKAVYDAHYKAKFVAAGILGQAGGELQHLISDSATMQIIRWTDGGCALPLSVACSSTNAPRPRRAQSAWLRTTTTGTCCRTKSRRCTARRGL
jgi:isocitrate dehydrogenase